MTTKIPQAMIEEMRSQIELFDTEAVREVYRTGKFHNADRVVDLDKRYRWDLARACLTSDFICGLYDSFDANDTHIDTALRQIVSPL